MDSRASRSGARCRRIDRDHRCTYIIEETEAGAGRCRHALGAARRTRRYRSLPGEAATFPRRLSASLVERWGRPAGLCRRGPSGRRPRSLSAGSVRCAQQRSVGSAAAVLHGARRVEASPDADRAVHAASAADDRPAADRVGWHHLRSLSRKRLARLTGASAKRYRSSRSKSCSGRGCVTPIWARKNDTEVNYGDQGRHVVRRCPSRPGVGISHAGDRCKSGSGGSKR